MHKGLLAAATACLLAGPGCKHPPTFVGAWKGTVLGMEAVADFKDDRSLALNFKQGSMGADLTGKYEVTAKTISLNLSDYKLTSVPDSLQPLAKKLFDPLKGKSLKLNYHFNSNDEVALSYQGKTDILKREASEG